MARNRKRAKERQRRTQNVGARANGGALTGNELEPEAAPDPLEHAAPDVELAEAQLAVGRPEDDVDTPEEERELEELALGEDTEPDAGPGAGAGPRTRARARKRNQGDGSGAAVATTAHTAPAPRAGLGPRLVNFLKGSWAELQRVQWPDRRQVVQATGVVIGFVIVAGLYLGLADWASARLMDFILK